MKTYSENKHHSFLYNQNVPHMLSYLSFLFSQNEQILLLLRLEIRSIQ